VLFRSLHEKWESGKVGKWEFACRVEMSVHPGVVLALAARLRGREIEAAPSASPTESPQ